VLGQTGQQSALDEQGRIQVSLWPATDNETEEGIGLWLPVAVTGARIDPGGLPMAGSDGWVSFLDSDPDRPVFCASTGHRSTPRSARRHEPRSDSRLLLDWLIDPTDTGA
jgi:type VI secretion system secreted protein VgrG